MIPEEEHIMINRHPTTRTVQLITAMALAGTVTGAQASNPLSFSDEAVARGINYTIGNNYAQFGGGMMMGDLDGDGDLDIVISGADDLSIGVFENDGAGNFTDVSAASGIAGGTVSAGVNAADYDNDGDLDILINGWLAPTRLYRNNGDFTFTDVAAAAGIDVIAPSFASSWGDVDGDGNLDIYASVRTLYNAITTRNFYFHNNGDGTFTDLAAAMGIDAGDDPTLLSSFFDYDRDGDDDLYLGTDKGSGGVLYNRLYRNDGGAFTEVTAAANAEAYVDCMGIAVGDLNFDGYFDLYVTNTPPGNKLLMFDGVSAYVDQTVAAGVGSYRVGWGTVFADFDNDTELDIYVCNMMGENRLYRGSQVWPLVDEGPSSGVNDPADVFCVAVGDVDGDNDLDMLVGTTNGNAHLYINNSVDAQTNNWVRFNVVGNNDNQYGVGTCVDITTNGKLQVREVRAGVNYKVQDEYTVHFGLGGETLVGTIAVAYTGGEMRYLTNAPANETWTLYPQSRLGDPNNNGRVDWFELAQAIGARTGPGGVIVPGQEIFDMDGDFDIDNDDLALMGLGIRTPTAKRFNAGP
jgi:FG-GAP-like repeat/ASPIC and UnbV